MRLLAFVAFAAAAAAALAPAPASARPYGAAAFFADAVAPVRDLVHESLAAVASRAAATAGAAPRAKCNTTACVQQCFEPVRNFSDPCVQLNSTSGVSGNPDVFGPWSATERGVLDRLCGCRDSYVQYFRRISDFYECVGAELNLDPLVEYLDNVLDEFACLKNGDEYCPVLFNRAARFGGFRPFLDAEEGCESGRDVVDYLGCCTRALRDFLNTPPVDWDAVYSPPTNTTGPKLAARAKTAAPSTSSGPRPRGAHWPLRRGTGGIGRLAREALARSPARALIVNASVPVPVQYDGSAPVTPEPGAEILGRRFNGSDVDAALARCNLTADDIDECLEPGDTETYTVVTVRVNASLNDTLPDDSARTRFAVAIRRDLARATGIFPWNFQVVSISQDFVVLIRVRGDDAKDAVDDALESDAGVQLNHTATEIPFFAGRSLNTDSASTDTEDVEAPSTGTEDGDDDDDDDDDDHGDSSPAPAAVPGLAVFAVAAVLAAVL